MDEIGEKLDALLNDPKQFGKIAQLASSILGDGGGKQAPPSAPEPTGSSSSTWGSCAG